MVITRSLQFIQVTLVSSFGSIDMHKIWNGGAYWPSEGYVYGQLKFPTFKNPRWPMAAILIIEKTVISLQRLDRSTCCSNFVKFGRREIGKIVRCLPDKKTKFRLALQPSLMTGWRPKSARSSPRQCTQSAPVSSKSVHFRRSYA